jgi:hypothetical protein
MSFFLSLSLSLSLRVRVRGRVRDRGRVRVRVGLNCEDQYGESSGWMLFCDGVIEVSI